MLHNPLGVARSVFGNRLPAGSLMFLGAIFGLIAGADSQSRGEPILYLLAPAWFFQAFLKLWKLLRYPRAHAWPFPLGLSDAQRRRISLQFLQRTLIECGILSATAACAFFILQSIVMHRVAGDRLADCAAVFCFEIVSLYLFLLVLVSGKLLKPAPSDFPSIVFRMLKPQFAGMSMPGLYRACGAAAKRVLPGDAAVLALRQALYLVRMDLFSLVVFPPLALAISAVILFYAKGGMMLVGDAAAIVAPLWLMIDRSPVFDEATLKLHSCPYYRVVGRENVVSNACFAVLACAPFALVFLAARIPAHGADGAVFLMHAAAFLAGLIAIAMVMTYRWLQHEWTSSAAGLAATTILCAVLGCAIPIYGILFPLSAALWAFALLKQYWSKRQKNKG